MGISIHAARFGRLVGAYESRLASTPVPPSQPSSSSGRAAAAAAAMMAFRDVTKPATPLLDLSLICHHGQDITLQARVH